MAARGHDSHMSENEATESAPEADGEADVEAEQPESDAETGGEEVADETATELESLRERAEAAEERADELESRLKRTQADFQNYKKRMKKRREQEQERATEDLVTRLLDVRDNLVRALEQDEDADIRDGVEATLRQFDRVFDGENVATIEPDPGAEVDPQRHEVLMRVESAEAEGTVDRVHRAGYEMAEKVLRPAQVTVSDGETEE
jgi:molecular chaperone GrpE